MRRHEQRVRELYVMHGGSAGVFAAHRTSTIDTGCVASHRSAICLLGRAQHLENANLTMIDLPPLLRTARLDRVVGGRRGRGPLLGAFNIRRMLAIGAILLFQYVGGHALGECAIGSLGGGFSCDFSHSNESSEERVAGCLQISESCCAARMRCGPRRVRGRGEDRGGTSDGTGACTSHLQLSINCTAAGSPQR